VLRGGWAGAAGGDSRARGERPGRSGISRRALLTGGSSACLAAALSPLSTGCCRCEQQSDKAWNNALNLAGVNPARQLTPASLQELVVAIQQAEQDKVGLRMTGSGHSFSDVAFSDGYLLSPTKLTRQLTLPRETLRDALGGGLEPAHLVRVEGGMRLRELNPRLFEQGLALSNMGGYDAQTVVGAAMTGTHGSGMNYGPIASQIASIELVTTGGVVLKVEPTLGITDPARFAGYITTPEGRWPAQLVADDETFNALAVSVGCMGVVYAVVLRVEPRFWLREVRRATTWGELSKPGGFIERVIARAPLETGAGAEPDYYEVYFNPYPPRRGDPPAAHRCLLTKRYKLLEKPETLSHDDRTRGRFGADALLAAAKLTGYGARLVEYVNSFPEAVPAVLRDALHALEDRRYVAASYDVFNLGPANLIRAYGIELGFDVRHTVPVVERVFVTARELAEDHQWMHNTPPSLRFVKSSPCHLAMMNGRDTMMLEMGMIACANGADDLLETYERRFMKEFGARPHWGLDLNVLKDFSQVRALYPESADRWRAVYERLNARGTFNATFTDRLGISIKAGSKTA
jgi:hypothetical protein